MVVQETPDVKKKKGEYGSSPANIYTSPGKKGSFGFTKTTLGERIGAKGIVGEYEYKADPFDLKVKAEKEYEQKCRKQQISESPFKPCNPPKRGSYGIPGLTLAGKGPGVAGEYVYRDLGPTPKVAQHNPEVPFKPSHPPHLGHNCTLNQFPKHLEDPEAPKLQAQRAIAKLQQEKLGSQNPWKPSMTTKTDCTRSIVQMNL